MTTSYNLCQYATICRYTQGSVLGSLANGPRRADKLAQMGITPLQALVGAHYIGVADALQGVTIDMVKAWQEEAGKLARP